MRGWVNYFRHAVCSHTLDHLRHFAKWRVIRWLRKRHRWHWGQFRRRFITPSGRWPILADGVILFNPASVPVTRYRYRGNKIPSPGSASTTSDGRNRREPLRREAHGGFGERHGETDRQQCQHRAPCRLNQRIIQRRRCADDRSGVAGLYPAVHASRLLPTAALSAP